MGWTRLKGHFFLFKQWVNGGSHFPLPSSVHMHLKITHLGNSLVVQWLGLHAFTAGGPGSIPGWELRSHKLGSAAKKKTTSNFLSCLINLFIYLFIYFWLCWVFAAAHGLSLAAASRVYSSLWCTGFSLRWLLLLRSTGSRRTGFSSCGTRASVVVARGL